LIGKTMNNAREPLAATSDAALEASNRIPTST